MMADRTEPAAARLSRSAEECTNQRNERSMLHSSPLSDHTPIAVPRPRGLSILRSGGDQHGHGEGG